MKPLLLLTALCLTAAAAAESLHQRGGAALLRGFPIRGQAETPRIRPEQEYDCKFEKSPSWKDFEAEAKKHRTLDEFLAALKTTSPGFFDGPALAFASESSQAEGSKDAVTREHPRIVAADGRFVLGMIGNRGHGRYDELELFEYLPKEARWEARRIRFPGRAARAEKHAVEGKETCLRCHGTTPRPIWMTYALWPGFYGQDGGTLDVTAPRPEAKAFVDFRKKAVGHPRYDLFRAAGGIRSDGVHSTNDKLTHLNTCLMASQLLRSKLWARYKFAIVGTLQCGNGAAFLPAATEEAHAKRLGRSREALRKETAKVSAEDFARKKGAALRHMPDDAPNAPIPFDGRRSDTVSDLRFLVEGQSDDPTLDMRGWSMNFTPGRDTFTYSFATGSAGIVDVWSKVLSHHAERDRDFLDLPTCEALQRKSREVLGRR